MRWPWTTSGTARAAYAEKPRGECDGFNEDDWQRAALRFISPLPCVTPAWLGGTIEQAERVQKQISEMRIKYAHQEPPRLRRHIERWLEYAENGVEKVKRDIATGDAEKERAESRARRDAEDAPINALYQCLKRRVSSPE